MSLIKLTDVERRRLHELLHGTGDAHLYRRTLAVLQIDRGEPVERVANTLGIHRSNVYRWVAAFAARRDPGALADRPRTGRPPRWGQGRRSALKSLLKTAPQGLGYAATEWTVPLLSRHLRACGGDAAAAACSRTTLRRQIALLGGGWNRGRRVLDPDPARDKKTAHPQ
jgi:transposase